MLFAFEAAEREPRPGAQRAWLTFVVVGAGPTGVELAGALAEIARHAGQHDFRHIDPSRARIVLLEGAPRVCRRLRADELSESAAEQLRALGVEVRTNAQVTSSTRTACAWATSASPRSTVLWARGRGGLAARRDARRAARPRRPRPGDADLTVPGHDERLRDRRPGRDEQDGKPVPGVAPAAMQMGRHVADSIVRRVARRAARAVQVLGQGLAGDDRPRRRRSPSFGRHQAERASSRGWPGCSSTSCS